MTSNFVVCGPKRLLRTLEAQPSRYLQIVIWSPFIGERTKNRFITFTTEARKRGCGVRLITSEAQSTVSREWPGGNQHGTRSIVLIPHLHAKVYLAIARNRADSWALVTSANLTEAGLRKNIELGLLFRACSPEGALIVEQIRLFLERVATTAKET
jgi:hypothetical protein